MARWLNRNASSLQGKLIVEKAQPNCAQVFLIPSEETLAQSGLDPAMATSYQMKLLLVNGQDNHMTIYPTNTLARHEEFLKPKYKQV